MSLIEAIKEEMKTLIVDGVLDPQDVVHAARNPNSAMHGQFEWNDGEAAEAYRLQQARALIKRVRVEVVRVDQEVVHIPSFIRTGEKKGYVETQVVVGTQAHSRAVIITLSQIATMLRNLGSPEVDDLLVSVEALKSRLSAELLVKTAV